MKYMLISDAMRVTAFNSCWSKIFPTWNQYLYGRCFEINSGAIHVANAVQVFGDAELDFEVRLTLQFIQFNGEFRDWIEALIWS